MSHVIEIDRRAEKGSQRTITRAPDGRIKTESSAGSVAEYEKLGRALAAEVDGEVRVDAGSRALYATDASNYRQVPIGVVVPRSREAVVKTMALCREFDAPVVMRGAARASPARAAMSRC